MGIILHRMHKNYAIMVVADVLVATYVPENLQILFKQRVKSWDACAQRKWLTQVCTPASNCDHRSNSI